MSLLLLTLQWGDSSPGNTLYIAQVPPGSLKSLSGSMHNQTGSFLLKIFYKGRWTLWHPFGDMACCRAPVCHAGDICGGWWCLAVTNSFKIPSSIHTVTNRLRKSVKNGNDLLERLKWSLSLDKPTWPPKYITRTRVTYCCPTLFIRTS